MKTNSPVKLDLFQKNINLATTVANELYVKENNPYIEREDLLQEALIGLCEAIDNYDNNMDIKLSKHINSYVNRELNSYIKRIKSYKR